MINSYWHVERIPIVRFVPGVVPILCQRSFEKMNSFQAMANRLIIINFHRHTNWSIRVCFFLFDKTVKSIWFLICLGELYSATSNEPVFGVNDPLIQRSFTDGKQLRTQQHDSNWLRSKIYLLQKQNLLNFGYCSLCRSVFRSNSKHWLVCLHIFSWNCSRTFILWNSKTKHANRFLFVRNDFFVECLFSCCSCL